MINEKHVIGVVGMPGSGKSAFDTIAEEMGFSVIIMGDAIRSEAVKRDLEPTPENIGKIMIRIRLDEGPEVVAKRCIPKIREAKTRGVVVDGIRSLMEVEEFRKSFPKFKVLYIHSPPEVRYQRVSNRRRSDDPQSWQIFVERDYRELGVGIGSAAAMADYVIVNNGTLPQLKKNVRKFLKEVQNE